MAGCTRPRLHKRANRNIAPGLTKHTGNALKQQLGRYLLVYETIDLFVVGSGSEDAGIWDPLFGFKYLFYSISRSSLPLCPDRVLCLKLLWLTHRIPAVPHCTLRRRWRDAVYVEQVLLPISL